MRRLPVLWIVATSTTALTQIAYGAEPAPYNWTGWYIGANAGAAWGRSDVTTTAICPAVTPWYFCRVGFGEANGAAVSAAGTGSLSDTGFTGGVQAGYNWQNGNIVLGAETDFGAFHFRGTQSFSAHYPVFGPFVSPTDVFTLTTSAEANWLYTARGRVGWAASPNVLVYATGGLALTRLKVANSFSDDQGGFGSSGASGGGSNSATKAGWVLGGGVEWAFDRHWSAKAEYLYVNFGSVNVTSRIFHPGAGAGYAQAINTSADLSANIVRAGINYKF
jgi:outer membrane immunogenic protein